MWEAYIRVALISNLEGLQHGMPYNNHKIRAFAQLFAKNHPEPLMLSYILSHIN